MMHKRVIDYLAYQYIIKAFVLHVSINTHTRIQWIIRDKTDLYTILTNHFTEIIR